MVRLGMIEKTCSRCRNMYPVSQFSLNKSHSDGMQNECKECQRKRKWSDRYELDSALAAEWLAGGCMSCGAEKSRGHRSERLQIDHDHETGRARGALCADCNRALGLLRDDPQRVLGLMGYALTWGK